MTYRLTAEPIEPSPRTFWNAYVWHAVECVRGREEYAKNILEQDAGIPVVFYPNEMSRWTVRGKKRERKKAHVPGLIFAKFKARPLWHLMKERAVIIGPLGFGIWPASLHPDTIRHLQGITVEAQALREARRQAMLIHAGDRARISEGPLQGVVVDVTEVSGPLVRFLFPTGKAGSADVASLTKERLAAE